MSAPARTALLAVLLVATAWSAPALASSPEDTTPGGSASLGFPIALVVLAVVATAYALIKRASNKKKSERSSR